MEINQCCEILGISRNASYVEAKLAYRELASIYHPDKHMQNDRLASRAAEKFKELLTAWCVLEADYKSIGQKRDIQEEQESLSKQRQEREREEAQKSEGGRKTEDTINHYLYTCEHCRTVNRLSYDMSIQEAQCGICKKYLTVERENAAKVEDQQHESMLSEMDDYHKNNIRIAKAMLKATVLFVIIVMLICWRTNFYILLLPMSFITAFVILISLVTICMNSD